MAEQHVVEYGKLKVYIDDRARGDDEDTFGDSVVAIIESQDFGGGEPHPFYDRVLEALARHYVADWPDPENYTLRQVLETMLRECAERPDTKLNQRFVFED